MKVEAAIAVEAGKPLEIDEIELEGPKEGECLVRLAATGVCHTDAFTLSGDDPEGLFPAVLGHEGAGVVEEVGPGVKSLAVGDHVIPLYTPECRQCKFCLSGKTNLCGAIRETQGQGLMPDGTSRITLAGQADPSLHGDVDVRACDGRSGDRAREGPQGRAARQGLPAGLWRDDRASGRCSIRPSVEPGSTVAIIGMGGIGLVGRAGRRDGRLRSGSSAIDTNPKKFELAIASSVRPIVVDPTVIDDLEAHVIDMTDGGVDYSFECIGNIETMGTALRICHKGWGESIIIGVAGAGPGDSRPPLPPRHGSSLARDGLRRDERAYAGPQAWSTSYMSGRVRLDEMVSRASCPSSSINEAFDLMHEGEVIRSGDHDLGGPGPVPRRPWTRRRSRRHARSARRVREPASPLQDESERDQRERGAVELREARVVRDAVEDAA